MTDGDAQFRLLADHAPIMVWRADATKACDFLNLPWLQFTGRRIEDELGHGWTDRVHPEDLDRCLKTYGSAFDAREDFSMQYRLRRHDGAWRWLLDNGRPYFCDGAFRGYFGSCTDITDMKQALDERDILVAELTHRIKNTLAVVVSMATQSWRSVARPEEFQQAFMGRLQALSRAHDVLFQQGWTGARLDLIAREALAAHQEGARITIAGPPVFVVASVAVALGIALHELATNAIKHGALSVPGGTVSLSWGPAIMTGDGAWNELHWQEAGGPPVAARPPRRGMGTRLLERGLSGQIGGPVSLDFAPGGVVCRMRLPSAANGMST